MPSALFYPSIRVFIETMAQFYTGRIVAKVNQQKIFQCWSSTSEIRSREKCTDHHNLSNHTGSIGREVRTVHRLNTDQFSDYNQMPPMGLTQADLSSQNSFKILPNVRDFDIFVEWDGENPRHTLLSDI